MAGVVIGRVVNIELQPDTFNATVTVSIQKRFDGKIPVDSRASILTAGLLGDNYIGITPGFSNKFLQQRSTIPLENTDSAVVLEQLISKFLGGKAISAGETNLPPKP
jgi:phospholipid/cholesterol/gamma-HCH transport system substrate-binding protein